MSVGTGAVRIAYIADGRRVEDSIDAEGAHDLLPGKLVDLGPFEDIVLAGWDTAAVTALLETLGDGTVPNARMVEESHALLAYARTVPELADKDYVLVVDLGKKGFSATALDVAGEYVEWTARTVDISGDRFDEVVRGIVMAKGILPAPVGPEGDQEYQAFFRELKELVSTSVGVRAPNRGPMLLSRKEFEREITPLVSDALDWASKQAPDAVLLIGGGAGIPAVRTIIEDKWNVPVHVPDDPAMAIAEGAALDERPAETPFDGSLHADVGIITVPDDASELIDAPELLAEPETLDFDTVEPETLDFDTVEEWMVDGLTVDQLATEDLTIPSTTFDTVPADIDLDEPALLQPEVLEPAAPEPGVVAEPVRRGRRTWSIRDASVLAAVSLLIVAVVGLVFTRGNTPPPTPLIDQQIPTDSTFAAALSAVADPADGVDPGPAELPVLGPVRLSDADLYEREFTYAGELYLPTVDPELPE
ncbi:MULTISPECIES: hypothetical protein [Rhodococcus]|uniref:DUF7159 domain-containing protein n=1 Tax=Rhodococcus cerastii TaxID=908616 RepID=A0ABU4D5K1_9NOCA|nr:MULTISPECIES: hypothetical protein [Rhodococcus]MDV6304646.1 hypothetical protein [Rhodococcus cerastii]MDV7991461.1 hypothetical protein [Rhodococcus sp. IEGM 1374]